MDVDAAHKAEQEALKRKRKERREQKSESRLEKERRQKEHRQRIIDEQNKKLKVGEEGSKFQAIFAKRAEGFIIDLNFRNAAPRPPVGPCFIGHGLDGELADNWTRYKPMNAVEANYSWKLHAEPDLGVPLAPSAMDFEGCYVDPSKQNKKGMDEGYDDELFGDETDKVDENKGPMPLHPDDAALIDWKGYKGDSAAEELQMKRDLARAEARMQGMNGGKIGFGATSKQGFDVKRSKKFQSRVLDEQIPNFMKKTTYLANDQTQSVHAFKSLAQVKAQTDEDITKKLKENAERLSTKERIEKSFDAVNKSTTSKRKHPTKKDVDAVFEIPLLPDDITWGYTFTHVVLDNLPKVEGKREFTSKQLETAFIGDVSAGKKGKSMECSLLVSDGDDSENNIYSAIQRYDLDVVGLKEEDAPNANFLFFVDEQNGIASYHPVSSRVQLSSGRPAIGPSSARVISKIELDENEIVEMEKRLAEIDADMAQKYGIDEKDDEIDANNAPATQEGKANPFDSDDSSDDDE